MAGAVANFDGRRGRAFPAKLLLDTGLSCSTTDRSYFKKWIESKQTKTSAFHQPKAFAKNTHNREVMAFGEIRNLRIYIQGGPKAFSFTASYIIADILDATGKELMIGWDILEHHFRAVGGTIGPTIVISDQETLSR